MFYSLAFVNGSEWDYYQALVCTPGFTILVKAILTIFDLVTGYLIYMLVKEHTGDGKKAVAAFGLWFLCPIVIYTSAIHGMFDVIAVMTLVLTVLLLFRRRYGLAGAVFAVSIFTKFFPFYLTLILRSGPKTREGGGCKKKTDHAGPWFRCDVRPDVYATDNRRNVPGYFQLLTSVWQR